jgi:uncharacterized protein YkwD
MPKRARTTKRKGAARAAAPFLVAAMALAASPAGASAATPLTSSERAFLGSVNAVRAKRSLPRVTLDADLVRAARSHSAEMVRTGVFRHGDFMRRLVSFGANGPIVGEDLGWTVEDAGATGRIVRWWLASPPHRLVLLRGGFRRVGIGVARGSFLGRPHCIVVTADFEGR